jgi:hypothetical protein
MYLEPLWKKVVVAVRPSPGADAVQGDRVGTRFMLGLDGQALESGRDHAINSCPS